MNKLLGLEMSGNRVTKKMGKIQKSWTLNFTWKNIFGLCQNVQERELLQRFLLFKFKSAEETVGMRNRQTAYMKVEIRENQELCKWNEWSQGKTGQKSYWYFLSKLE